MISDDVKRVARAVMLARTNGGCLVKDWDAECRDNPHVEEAANIARAAMAETLRIAAKRWAQDFPKEIDVADWLNTQAQETDDER